MDVFNSLWDNPEQRRRPPDDNFQLFTMEEWFAMSATHKILTGSLQCPLPQEIESSKGAPKSIPNRNIRDLLLQKAKSNEASNAAIKDSNEDNLYIPGCTKFPQLARVSALTSQEHADCLKLWLKFDGKPLEELTPTEKIEYQLFQSLYARVKEEQKEFLECAKENWPEFKVRTTNIKSDPHNYFLQFWTNKVTLALSQYSHKYIKLRTFSLQKKVGINKRLHFIKNLLNIGRIPVARLPDFHSVFRVASSILKLRNWSLLSVPATTLNGTLHKVPVSRDPNAERLARLHGANVVISTSGVRCLLDNHDEKKYPPLSGVGKSWVLPIIVKEHRSFCNGKPVTKTIVFIDKQLPKPKMTGIEKVSWYQKQALFAAVVNRSHPGGIEFDLKGEEIFIRKNLASTAGTVKSSEKNAEELAHKSNLLDKMTISTIKQSPSNNDSSNLCATPPLTEDLQNKTKNTSNDDDGDNEDDDDDDDDDDDALMIDLPDSVVSSSKQLTPDRKVIKQDDSEVKDQALKSEETIATIESKQLTPGRNVIKSDDSEKKDKVLKSEETINTIDSDAKSSTAKPACSGDSIRQAQPVNIFNKWEKLPPPESVKIVNGNALPVSTTNLTYNLWCLKSEEEETDANHSNSTGVINLLIRSRVDCCESLGQGKYQPICLATKPEYQLEYAPSIIPLSDLTRQWAKLLIQPDTALARIRVNVQTAELVKLEKRTISEIEEETQAHYKTALSDNLQYFWHILSELTQLPTGQYLLYHSAQMGANAELFKSSNETDVIDWHLPKDYANRPEIIDCDMPWPESDTNVILPKHLQVQCMPCSFHCPKGPTLRLKPSKPQNQQPLKAANTKKKKKKNKSKKPANKAEQPEEEARPE